MEAIAILSPLLELSGDLRAQLVKAVQDALSLSQLDIEAHCVILNYRDPSYSATLGGYRPVEVCIIRVDHAVWQLSYLTEFKYDSAGELSKTLDFEPDNKWFTLFGRPVPTDQLFDLFELWQNNFTAYADMGVYNVETSVS